MDRRDATPTGGPRASLDIAVAAPRSGGVLNVRALIVAALIAAACRAGGAGQPPATSPPDEPAPRPPAAPAPAKEEEWARWVAQLDDPARLEQAVAELESLRDPRAIPALGASWKRNNYARILSALVIIAAGPASGTPVWKDALPFLVAAAELFLDDSMNPRAIENAVLAAEALGRARRSGSGVDPEPLLRMVAVDLDAEFSGQRARMAALRALGSFPGDDRVVAALIGVLDSPDAVSAPFPSAAAADALAELRDPRAVPALIRTMYAVPMIYQFCRRALVAIGDPATDSLIEVFRLSDPAMNEFARQRGLNTRCRDARGKFIGGPGSRCTAPSNLEFKAAAVLGDTRARRVIPHLLAELSDVRKGPMPAFYSADGVPGPPQHLAVLHALRKFGADDRAAAAVLAFARARATDDFLAGAAIDTYSFLTRSTAALPWLADLLSHRVDRLGKRGGRIDPRLLEVAEVVYGRLASKPEHLAPLTALIARRRSATAADGEMYLRRAELALIRALIGIRCGDRADCYLDIINSAPSSLELDLAQRVPGLDRWSRDDQHAAQRAARERAFLELSKLGAAARSAQPDLLRILYDTDRATREGVLLALAQVSALPCDACIRKIDEIIDEQRHQTVLEALNAELHTERHYYRSAAAR